MFTWPLPSPKAWPSYLLTWPLTLLRHLPNLYSLHLLHLRFFSLDYLTITLIQLSSLYLFKNHTILLMNFSRYIYTEKKKLLQKRIRSIIAYVALKNIHSTPLLYISKSINSVVQVLILIQLLAESIRMRNFKSWNQVGRNHNWSFIMESFQNPPLFITSNFLIVPRFYWSET